MRVNWTIPSLANLLSIREYISINNPMNAERFIAELFDSVDSQLHDFPRSGRKIPDKNNEDYREIIYGNYRIMYRVFTEEVRVLAVRNSKQLFALKEIE